MNILTIATHKGGAGKTTTAHWIAYHLAQQHRQHVLILDLDPQGNLSKRNGYAPPISGYTVADVLRGREKLCKVVRPTTGNLSIAPGDIRLEDARAALATEPLGINALRKAIGVLAPGMYDWIVIDTPPAADILVLNALIASDYVVTPAQPEEADIDGAARIREMITWLAGEGMRTPTVLGSIATRVNRQTLRHRAIMDAERIPGPILAEIPERKGIDAETDIREGYRVAVETIMQMVGGDHA